MRIMCGLLVASGCALHGLAGTAPAGAPAPAFRHAVIDAAHYGDCKAVGDLDGDGADDFVVAGGKPDSRLVWYASPGWKKTVLATENQEFTTEMQVADVDGDRDLDLVVPLGGSGTLYWYENPRPRGNPSAPPWARHRIGEQGEFVHDLEAADFNADGRVDLVARAKDGPTVVWLRQAADWLRVAIPAAGAGEGTAVADLNRDPRPDIVQNGYWLECPADSARGTWTRRTLAAEWPTLARVAAGDLNGDGRTDVALAPSESAGRLAWFAAPEDPRRGPWRERPVAAAVSFVHSLQLADVDGDRALDLIFAEMAQSATKRVGYSLNRDRGERWELQVLAATGSHNLRVGRSGTPATLTLFGCNWQGPPVELWRQGAER